MSIRTGHEKTRIQNLENPGLSANGEPLSGRELAERVRDLQGDRLLLSFSGGKDSLAMWLFLRRLDVFAEVIPYFLYWLPGLSFVEQALAYYERVFGVHIVQLPHPLFYRLFGDAVYQLPQVTALVEALDLPEYDYADVDNLLAAERGLPAHYFCAIGIRAADNIDRRNLIHQQGALGIKRRHYYYPIWDWTIDQVADEILTAGVKLPADYRYWGRTLAAYDYQYLKPLREHFPADYDRILEWFPMLEAEMFRYERLGKYGKAN